jgi:hypothetical protein
MVATDRNPHSPQFFSWENVANCKDPLHGCKRGNQGHACGRHEDDATGTYWCPLAFNFAEVR